MAKFVYELCWKTEFSGPMNTIYGTQKRAEESAEKYYSATHDGVLAFHWKNSGLLYADSKYTGYSVVTRIVF